MTREIGTSTAAPSNADAVAAGRGAELIADRVWRIRLPLNVAHIEESNCYVLVDDRGDAHIIDTGFNSTLHWRVLLSGLAAIGASDRVRTVVGTHLHRDHIGMAARLRAVWGTRIILHEIEARHSEMLPPARSEIRARLHRRGVPQEQAEGLLAAGAADGYVRGVPVDATVSDGEVLEYPGLRLEMIHTPGHTAGHVCVRVAERRVLLTGDHVLPDMNPGLGLGGPHAGDVLGDYLRALDRVAGFSDHLVLPGHGSPFRGLAARCERIRRHHARRTREIEKVVSTPGALSVWEVANSIAWRRPWPELGPVLQNSALLQTELHLKHLGLTENVRG